jgi:hypothetical protein
MSVGQQPGTSGPQDMFNTVNGGEAAAPPGAPPTPLPTVGQVQYTQGPAPAPPPDYSALGGQQAKTDFASASPGSGWEYDSEEMDKVIRNLEDVVINDLRRMEAEGQYVTGIDPPGDEVVSQNYSADANRSGESWNNAFKGNTDFLDAYIRTLKDIRDAYQRQDDAALDALQGKAV